MSMRTSDPRKASPGEPAAPPTCADAPGGRYGAPVTEPSTAPAGDASAAAAARTAAGYAVAGPAVELGSVMHGGTPHPDAGVRVPLAMINRHGLIAGATGTGKTKTLQLIAEQLA